jgi:hypothetical protein
MNNWCICWFLRIFLLWMLIFKRLTARRLYKSFGVKGLNIGFQVTYMDPFTKSYEMRVDYENGRLLGREAARMCCVTSQNTAVLTQCSLAQLCRGLRTACILNRHICTACTSDGSRFHRNIRTYP